MTTSSLSANADRWAKDLTDGYKQWAELRDYESEDDLLDALGKVFLQSQFKPGVPHSVVETADTVLDQMMDAVACQREYFTSQNESRLINYFVEYNRWQRYASNPETKLLLAALCITYGCVLDAGKPSRATPPVLAKLMSSWAQQIFAPIPGNTVDAVTDALFGPAWTLLYADDLGNDAPIYIDLLRLQPRFIFEPDASLPKVSLPGDLA